MLSKKIEEKIIGEIKSLGLDMIEEAGSGHPGIVLGAAPILYTLYLNHLRFDASNPNFYNRDRFIMSAGHGSSLLYSILYFAGYDLSLDDLKAFRRLNSKTPGHPKYKKTPGVEMTTGPLGQGFATAVGYAIAEKHTEALINKKEKVIDYNIYCLCGDGDLMEGVSYEAASLAGSLKLDNLIVLYDSNKTTMDGKIDNVFDEDITKRFESMNWTVLTTSDEPQDIDDAIIKAKEADKPTIIQVATTIGKDSSLADSNKSHSGCFDKEEISKIKTTLGVRDIPFTISNEAVEEFRSYIKERNKDLVTNFDEIKEMLDEEEMSILNKLINPDKSIKLTTLDYTKPDDNEELLRISANKVLNSYSLISPLIIGGNADTSSSTKIYLNELTSFTKDNYIGRNINFGVREHAMASIANGLALAGYRPFVSTFLSFSDYLKPALRLTALMDLPVTYIFTHDSISIGQDGPTHQPVEQLVSLRAIPNMEVFRPADSNEVIGSFKTIYENNSPSSLIIGRGSIKILESTSISATSKGGYIVHNEERKLDGVIIATGEEVTLALEVMQLLKEKGYDLRVVSMPSIERYNNLTKEEKEELLPLGVKKFVIEKGSSYSWYSFVYKDSYLFTLDKFGASGKTEEVNSFYGFTKEEISLKIEALLK
ncbi:transketolase [Clostridium sp. CAG:451]|nr:transketolase [Clostridium sp. CAG:451]